MTNANNLASLAQTKAAADATGTRYCSHGHHYARTEGGMMYARKGPHGSKQQQWICAACAQRSGKVKAR